MLNLRKVYPYGLNDSLNEVIDTSDVVGCPFPSLPRSYCEPSGRSISKNKKVMDHNLFFAKILYLLNNKIYLVAHFLRVSLFSMGKNDLKSLAQRINKMRVDDDHILFSTWFKMAYI